MDDKHVKEKYALHENRYSPTEIVLPSKNQPTLPKQLQSSHSFFLKELVTRMMGISGSLLCQLLLVAYAWGGAVAFLVILKSGRQHAKRASDCASSRKSLVRVRKIGRILVGA
ncbi:unnamed protein product [Durusdinium trenchii]|uniref:Uncharacterized protein n=1 Tax=Durusdinium trenchii TaxID=1381693 RepID=A0ABP0K8U3_9DINO